MARRTELIDRERYLLLRGILEDRRRDIHEKLRSLRESIPMDTPDVRDAEEQSVDDFVQEVAEARVNGRVRERHSNEVGLAMGRRIGEQAAHPHLAALP